MTINKQWKIHDTLGILWSLIFYDAVRAGNINSLISYDRLEGLCKKFSLTLIHPGTKRCKQTNATNMQKNEMFRCDQDDLKKLWNKWLFYYSAKHFFKTIGLRRPVFEFNGCNL